MENKYQNALNYIVDNFIDNIEVKDGQPMNKETECVLKLQEAAKIAELLESKEGWIKSQKGNYMLLKVSGIHYKGNKFMVNGYCENGNGCRSIPLNKVYLDKEEVVGND